MGVCLPHVYVKCLKTFSNFHKSSNVCAMFIQIASPSFGTVCHNDRLSGVFSAHLTLLDRTLAVDVCPSKRVDCDKTKEFSVSI